MKIVKSSYEYRNTILFIILSLIFVSSIDAIAHGEFLFAKVFLTKVLLSNYLIFLVGFLSLYFVIKFLRFSEWIMLTFLILVVGKSFYFLTFSFNKLILGLDFLYLFFAFYFFTSWDLFVNSAIHLPRFSKNDLEKETRYSIKGRIVNANSDFSNCLLTNIDEEGCFVMLQDDHLIPFLNGNYRLEVELDSVLFQSEVKVVSIYDKGLGLQFLISGKNELRSLSGLYQICLQRGFV